MEGLPQGLPLSEEQKGLLRTLNEMDTGEGCWFTDLAERMNCHPERMRRALSFLGAKQMVDTRSIVRVRIRQSGRRAVQESNEKESPR